MIKTYLYIPQKTHQEVSLMARHEKASRASILRQALEEGLVKLRRNQKASIEVFLELAEIGKKYKVHGPKDASVRMDDYLWGKYKI